MKAFAVAFQGVLCEISQEILKNFSDYEDLSPNSILENFQSVNQLIINSHTDTFPVI